VVTFACDYVSESTGFVIGEEFLVTNNC